VAKALALSLSAVASPAADAHEWLDWQPLPPLPDAIGVAGPFGGTHRGALIVAGGANFAAADAADLWDVAKKFQAAAYVLPPAAAESKPSAWQTGFALDRPLAYGASASTPAGVVCVGGEDGTRVFAEAFLLVWEPQAKTLARQPLPRLPSPSTAGGAAVVGNHVYVVAGQKGLGLDSATDSIWRLDITKLGSEGLAWEPLPAVPGGPRAFAIVAAQHHSFADCLYVIGGRRQQPGTTDLAGIEPLADCHEFSPARFAVDPASGWRKRADPPLPLMAGTAAAFGQGHLIVLAAADGESLAKLVADPGFAQRHPGFPRQAWAYHAITDTWTSAGATPSCPVTTPAVAFDGGVALVSGEIRPRVRTSDAWHIKERSGSAGEEKRHD
jgi:N-acetylneuraminic acid mutarotase